VTRALRVLIVVPAWNEEASIASVVNEVHRTLPDSDVLVVNDGSTDQTGSRAVAAGAVVARLPYNLGVGGAMRLGFRYAVQCGYDTVVQIDADGQHDPAFVPQLLDRIEAGADLVIGARFAGVGEYPARGPRRWAIAALSAVLSRLAGTRLTDTTSGMRAMSRPLFELFAWHYPVDYLGDTVEALAMAARRGFRIEQEPVAMRLRTTGRSSHAFGKATVYLGRAFVVLVLALIRR
jgi:glycosyltransferase involved in cell wall biosynthesis